jgi:quercetin dioxygenase-like cupin family protein
VNHGYLLGDGRMNGCGRISVMASSSFAKGRRPCRETYRFVNAGSRGDYNRRMHILLFPFLLAAAIQITSIDWKDAPPSMPAGTKIAVLEGSPQQPGIFTIRLKVPAGAKVAPHTHPRPERVTVLSGSATVNMGGTSKTFTTGGFYINPPNEVHDLVFGEETVLQLTCEGPWVLEYVK